MLVNINISQPCPPLADFVMAPLHCGKLLWRAADEEEWEWEWARAVQSSPVHGILRNGDLVSLRGGASMGHCRRADWDRWYTECDELGFLAVLAASL